MEKLQRPGTAKEHNKTKNTYNPPANGHLCMKLWIGCQMPNSTSPSCSGRQHCIDHHLCCPHPWPPPAPVSVCSDSEFSLSALHCLPSLAVPGLSPLCMVAAGVWLS